MPEEGTIASKLLASSALPERSPEEQATTYDESQLAGVLENLVGTYKAYAEAWKQREAAGRNDGELEEIKRRARYWRAVASAVQDRLDRLAVAA